ncbi:MAG: hypothetical protein AABY22_17050 [Nanoarchaeota archaeon]
MILNMSWQYIAGFFDGEGNIHIYNNTTERTYADRLGQRHMPGKVYTRLDNRVALSVSQSVRFYVLMVQRDNVVLDIMSKFIENYGIKTSTRLVMAKGKTNGQGITSNFDVKTLSIVGGHLSQLKFLECIYPYSIVKKEKIGIAIKFIKSKKWGKHSFHEKNFKQWRELRRRVLTSS